MCILGLGDSPTRAQREQALLLLLPDGSGHGTRFTLWALADELLVALLLDICVIGQSPGYDLSLLSEEDLAYLEACCADPSYLVPITPG